MSKPRNGWLFLFVVLAMWAVTARLFPERIEETFKLFVELLSKVAPAMGLVFVLLFAANLFAEGHWMMRLLAFESGPRCWLVAILAGVLATGPVYAWYAMLAELRSRGLRPGPAAAFLFALGIKLPLLPLLVHYFGLAYAVALTAWMVVFAAICGLLTELFDSGRFRAER